MSGTPPKPKVGSLRDRIAAFEKPASTTPPGPPPTVRPKPAGFSTWKPKVPSPPSSPAAGTTEHASSSAKVGGMSASDAKESITKAGSLKDRMAALQGKGAFGAPPSVAPKPAVEKPRWKPPPVVHAPVDVDDHPAGESSTANIAAAVERTISPPVAVKPQESIVRAEGEEKASSPPAAVSGEGEGDDSTEAGPADPEEEDRQRRAAIAARMARLGGARLGMAPPVFGKKPPVRRPTQEEAPKPEESKPEEEPKRDISSPEAVKPADVPLPAASDENLLVSPPTSTTPAAEETQSYARTSPEFFPKRKNSGSTSILSSESTESHSARSPASMPVPSVPRRAGPPRKKPVKPAAPPPEVPEEETPATGIAAVEEEVSPPAIDEPKGESVVESVETPRDDLLENVQGLKAEIQQEIKIPLVAPEPSLSPPPIAEEATPISTSPPVTVSRSDSLLMDEPSGIRSPPPSPVVITEEKESEQFEVEGEEDGGEDDESDIAEALATPPIPVLLSPSREAPVAVAKHEKELTPVSPPLASEQDTTDEAEEEERKKRVAERLAKMGGINPFAMSPPMQAKPQQEASRSPPQVPVAFVPSSPSVPSAAQNRESVIRSPSPEPTRKDSTTESNAEEEEEAFDEDDDEGEIFENEPGPITNKHYEKPKDSRAEPLERPNIPVRPPVPPATRPPVQVQQFEADDDSGSDYGDDDIANTSAPSIPVNLAAKLTSPPKPPSPPARPAQPPRRIVPQTPEENEVEDEDEEEEDVTDEEADERLAQSQLFIPPPTGRTPGAIPPNRRYLQEEEDGNGSESDSPALPILHRKSLEVPAGRPTQLPYPSDGNESWDLESDHDGQALPIPPRRTSGPPPPRVVPPPPPPALHHPPPVHRSPPPPAPAAVAHLLSISSPYVPRTASGSSEEILDEEEGDPIDPAFHSPSRRASTINLVAQPQSEAPAPAQSSSPPPAPPPTTSHRAPSEQEQTAEAGKDADLLRRNTIAERMAKLGGIKFGAAPLPTSASRRSTHQPSNEEESQAEDATDAAGQPTEFSEEEEERARKERIAAKMASMGGMRIGMMPMGMGGFPPQRSHVLKEETAVVSPPSLPPAARAVPPSRPPPPPTQASQVPDSDSDYGSAAASEDGVKVEAEESSELEEVNYEDAEETEEEAPPPIPSRAVRPTRRQSSMDQPTSPPISPSRPPVPTSVPARRRSSVQTTRSIGSIDNTYGSPPQRSSSFMPSSQSEYVMVEEPESQEMPPQPSVRYSRLPPMRSTPQAPTMQSSEATTESISSQWELPSIPTSTFDFGGGADLSLSWTDAGEPTSPSTSSQPAAAPPSKRATLPSERQLSADDLIALWGRVGVQVCEIATSMFEKSRKTLIGDGTYTGFVQAVVATVPNAAPVPTASGEYGYVVYLQNGASVQKRASEIMPGDIVEIHDAKFKGHKGLQTYHQNVGAAGEDLVGVVGEFEAKKSKIRVFHANQHVGQQTVESVSYRLEDLKSGIVKVYRALEA